MPDSRSRIFEVGMNDILLKPISPESLYRKVYQWTGIKNSKTDDNKNINIDFSPLSSSVNIKDGLHYASNNEELYCRLLFMFLDSHGDFIENFAETIKDKDTVSAARQMHTLKGTSGTLGMTGLHKVAEDIEEEIKNGKGDEALNNLPLKLENNLKPVLNAICEFRKKINNKKEK
jgi:HPt (histidine-containing phosphotransfer) domain-containing protein